VKKFSNQNDYDCTLRGKINAKDLVGDVEMYFLEGTKGV
jgi:hypothetical protein